MRTAETNATWSRLLPAAALVLAGLGGPVAGQAAPPGEKDPVRMLRAVARDMGKVEALLLRARTDPETRQAAQAAVEKIEKLLGRARKGESKVISSLDELIDEIRKRQKARQCGASSRPQGRTRRRPPDDPRQDPRFRNRRSGAREDPNRKRGRADRRKTDRKPPPARREHVKHPDKSGIWGRLPDKLFKLITNREQTVFPVAFQEYVEQYFKRLAEQKTP